MGKDLRWDVWLVVFDLLRAVSTTIAQSKFCAELEFVGLHSEDKLISVRENSFINLIFYVKTDDCQPPINSFQVKVSHGENNLVRDLCNVFFLPHCNVSVSSSPSCRCLNSSCAQFFMKVSPSDSRTYTWTWFSYKDREKKGQRDIGIHVIATSNTTDYKVVIILSSVGVVVVGSSVAVCIFWTRTKYKADVNVDDNEDYSSEFDCVSDDFVTTENGQSPEETYDHLRTCRDISQSRV